MFHRLLLRFKLNSIGYGPKILGVIGLLLAGVPLALYGIYLVLGLWGIDASATLVVVKASLVIGGVLLGVFVILLAIEFAQDHYLDTYYRKRRQSRVKIPDGYFECQSCGHRRVRETDRSCPVCGKTFMQDCDD